MYMHIYSHHFCLGKDESMGTSLFYLVKREQTNVLYVYMKPLQIVNVDIRYK